MNVLELTAAQERALEFCNYCPRLCHFACPAGHGDASETATAWGMMSLANMIRKGALEPDIDDATNLFRCTSCGRCTDFCRHDIPVAEVLQVTRGALHANGLTPPVLAELNQVTPFHIDTRGGGSEVLFIPACHPTASPSGEDDANAETLLALVDAAAGGSVHVASPGMCCGTGAKRAGFQDAAARHDAAVNAATSQYAVVISECGCAPVAGEAVAMSTAAFLAEHAQVLAERVTAPPMAVTLHGGCRARRPVDYSAAEKALLAAVGVTATDAFAIDQKQECCGGDGVYSRVSPDGAARAARAVVAGARTQAEQANNVPLVTSTCACAAHMTRSADERVRSVLEIVAERCR